MTADIHRQPSRRLLLLAFAWTVACADVGDPVETAIRARVDAFQAALRAADTESLYDLLTRESLPAIEQLRPSGNEDRLIVDAVQRRDPGRYDVAVREASGDGATAGVFVVVREAGAWRIDLVESAAVTNGTEKGPPSIEPAGLTPEQIDEIRANHGGRSP